MADECTIAPLASKLISSYPFIISFTSVSSPSSVVAFGSFGSWLFGSVDELVDELLDELFQTKIDDTVSIVSPFYCDCGPRLKLGKNITINKGATILSGGLVEIEDNNKFCNSIEKIYKSKSVNLGSNSLELIKM